jgi:hypothetical protein
MHDVYRTDALSKATQALDEARRLHESVVFTCEQAKAAYERIRQSLVSVQSHIERSEAQLIESRRALENCWQDPFKKAAN